MSGTGFTDWMDLGIFPLQDHEDAVPLQIRQALVGGRVSSLPEPGQGSSNLLEYGRDHDLGTLGDIHPWLFWQTRDRAERGMGAWAQSFAGMVSRIDEATTGPITGPGPNTALPGLAIVHPVRTDRVAIDGRFQDKFPGWPSCFPALPLGTSVVVMPGTEETEQHEVMLHADPRMYAVNVDGPAAVGSLVVDLQPENEPNSERSAPLQSMMRVVALDAGGAGINTGGGNAIAWQCARSGVDKLLGFGLCYAKLDGGGPTTGGPVRGPITQAPGGSIHRIAQGLPGGAPGASAAAFAGNGGTPGNIGGPPATGDGLADNDGNTPCDFGEFSADPQGGHGLAFMAAEASGPFHPGSAADKHRVGTDRDGHPINSGHISVDAYFYQDANKDGPFLFEPDLYPNPPPLPLITRTHLVWDPAQQHNWFKGQKQGKWRWFSETNVYTPPTQDPPTTDPPTTVGPPTGGPPSPAPTGPGAPGPGPGVGPPTSGTPRPGPTTPGPGTKGPTTGGRGPTITTPPKWPGYGPGKFGRWPGEPGYEPVTGSGAANEPTTGGGFSNDGGLPGGVIVEPIVLRSKTLKKVGNVTLEDEALFLIHHPMMESFAELAFRPQLMVDGADAFTHNPNLGGTVQNDEATRPQVLAMRSWGGQDESGGWDYVESPTGSRARGGTSHGGILYTPPGYELEDYFAIGSTQDVRAISTASFVAAAPGVGFALGTPATNGGLNPKSVVIAQTPTGNDPLTIYQLNSAGAAAELFGGQIDQGTGEVVVTAGQGGTQALRIPRGTAAQRPSTLAPSGGEIRVKTDGGTDVMEFWEAQGGAWTTIAAGAGTGDLLADGTIPMTAAWNFGGFELQNVSGLKVNGTGSPDELLQVVTTTANQGAHIGMAFVGNYVSDPDFAIFANDTVHSTATSYALLQYTDGSTYLNSASGTTIQMRVSNTTVATVASTGLTMAQPLAMGSNKITGLTAGTAAGEAVEVVSAVATFMGFVGGTFTGNVTWEDSDQIRLGTGGDSTIAYDGTNTVWNPAAVGSGHLRINSDVGIDTDPSAKLHLDQSSTTGAKPVLIVDQADVSEELIKFIGSSHASTAAQSLVDGSALGTPGTLTGWLKIVIQDDAANISDGSYFIPFYATPTA